MKSSVSTCIKNAEHAAAEVTRLTDRLSDLRHNIDDVISDTSAAVTRLQQSHAELAARITEVFSGSASFGEVMEAMAEFVKAPPPPPQASKPKKSKPKAPPPKKSAPPPPPAKAPTSRSGPRAKPVHSVDLQRRALELAHQLEEMHTPQGLTRAEICQLLRDRFGLEIDGRLFPAASGLQSGVLASVGDARMRSTVALHKEDAAAAAAAAAEPTVQIPTLESAVHSILLDGHRRTVEDLVLELRHLAGRTEDLPTVRQTVEQIIRRGEAVETAGFVHSSLRRPT